MKCLKLSHVALLAEGVDRNDYGSLPIPFDSPSPSSRRAWIEIFTKSFEEHGFVVALLAEGVDRNLIVRITQSRLKVALLAEGVDRNACIVSVVVYFVRRPPRGGRG